MSYWDEFDKADKEESGGSGGIVGNLTIEPGYKVYASGASNAESFFPVAALGKNERTAAKRKAEAYAQEMGANGAKWAVQIRVAKEGGFSGGKAATWNEDRFFVTDTWTDAFKKVVRPALVALGMDLPFKGWGRVGFKNDPFREAQGEAGKTDEDADGNPRFPLVAYPTELFASQAEALTAVGDTDAPAAPAFVPEGWTAEDWVACIPQIKEEKEMHGLNNAQLREHITETYGVDLPMARVIELLK